MAARSRVAERIFDRMSLPRRQRCGDFFVANTSGQARPAGIADGDRSRRGVLSPRGSGSRALPRPADRRPARFSRRDAMGPGAVAALSGGGRGPVVAGGAAPCHRTPSAVGRRNRRQPGISAPPADLAITAVLGRSAARGDAVAGALAPDTALAAGAAPFAGRAVGAHGCRTGVGR